MHALNLCICIYRHNGVNDTTAFLWFYNLSYFSSFFFLFVSFPCILCLCVFLNSCLISGPAKMPNMLTANIIHHPAFRPTLHLYFLNLSLIFSNFHSPSVFFLLLYIHEITINEIVSHAKKIKNSPKLSTAASFLKSFLRYLFP